MEPNYPVNKNEGENEVGPVIDLMDHYVDDTETDLGFAPIDVDAVIALLKDEILERGGLITQSDLNCFVSEDKKYLNFINDETTWVNDFTRFWLPSEDVYAWLSPYTGNAHNRSFFSQLALYVVARSKQCNNRTWHPDLFEPFVGSGQIFMGASAFADLLMKDEPFQGLGGGDLNPYLICAYQAMTLPDFINHYRIFAADLDFALDPSDGQGGALDASVYAGCLRALNALPITDDTHLLGSACATSG